MKTCTASNRVSFMVDDEDYDFAFSQHWTMKGSGYLQATISKGTRVYLHKYLLQTEGEVDHIDHNPLNNQKSNLRICTRSQNNQNYASHKIGGVGTSKYKGVCYSKKYKNWVATIMLEEKSYFLGSFVNEIDAAKAYNIAAQQLFGDYAFLNEV